jgi:hypothetical protein
MRPSTIRSLIIAGILVAGLALPASASAAAFTWHRRPPPGLCRVNATVPAPGHVSLLWVSLCLYRTRG